MQPQIAGLREKNTLTRSRAPLATVPNPAPIEKPIEKIPTVVRTRS